MLSLPSAKLRVQKGIGEIMSLKQPTPKGGRRMVQCKKHKLHYDPTLHAGCVLCRKENPLGVVQRERPILAWLGALLLAAGIALAVIFRGNMAQLDAAADTAIAASTVRLDPAPYQAEVMMIENVLYQRETATAADTQQLQNGFAALGLALSRREQTPSATASAGELSALSTDLAAAADPATASIDLRATRGGWEKLRASLFFDASWFRRTVASPVVVAGPSAADAALIDQLRVFASQLESALGTATGHLAGLDDSAPPEVQRAAWTGWSTGWGRTLADLRSRLPAQPGASSDAGLGLAYDQLRSALDTLNQLASPDLPLITQRQAALDEARAAISQARAYVAQVERAR